MFNESFIKNGEESALAGVAQWTECRPVNQKVPSLISSQGTCLGCGPGPQQGDSNHTLRFLSLSVSLLSPLSKNKFKNFKILKNL